MKYRDDSWLVLQDMSSVYFIVATVVCGMDNNVVYILHYIPHHARRLYYIIPKFPPLPNMLLKSGKTCKVLNMYKRAKALLYLIRVVLKLTAHFYYIILTVLHLSWLRSY